MGRIRTVKPQHWNDRELPLISLHAHLLWISTWNFSDDKGIFENDPILIKSQSFPRRQDINPDMITQWLNELKDQNFIIPFTYKSVDYFITRTFSNHQKIDKPQPSKIPNEEIRRILGEDSPNGSGQISSVLYSNSSVKESIVMADIAAKSENLPTKNDLKEAVQDARPAKIKKKVFIPPTSDEVNKYFESTQ